MLRHIKKIVRFCFIILLALLFSNYLFDKRSLSTKTIVIDIHDTNYSYTPLHCTFTIIIVVLFLSYYSKITNNLYRNNKSVNYTFLILLTFIVVGYSQLMMLNYATYSIFPTTCVIPGTDDYRESYLITNPVYMAMVQIFLVLFLIYNAIKVGVKFKKIL